MNGLSRGTGRIAVLCLALALSACGPPSIEESIESARASIASSNFAEAAIHVRNALQVDSTHTEARLLMAEIAWQTGDLNTARLEFERARDVDAPPASYALRLAQVYVALGEPELALDTLDVAGLEATADVALVRGDAWISLGDYASAELALEDARRAGATEADIAYRRGRVAFARGDLAGANVSAGAALAADPDHVDALVLSGMLATRQAEYDEALGFLRRGIELHRAGGRSLRAVPLMMAVVEMEIARGDLDAAGAVATELAALVPQAPVSSYAAGLVAFRAGRNEEAVTALRAAVAGAPDEARFQSLLGAAQLAVGNLGQAEQQFQAILSRIRDDAAALQLLVETRLRQERPEAALDAFQRNPAAVDENDLVTLTLLARTYLALDDPASAIPSLERALELSPGNQAIALQLVDAYVRIGDIDAASEALRDAPELSGDTELAANARVLVAMLENDDRAAAEQYVNELIAERPGVNAQLTSAIYHQLTGDLDAALASADAALAEDPRMLQVHMVRGNLLQQLGDTEAAKAAFDEAISIAPENTTALGARAQLAATEQDYARAAELHERAYAVTASWSVLAGRASALRLAGDPSWSEPMREWLAANPEDARSWMFLGEQARESGENAAAVDAYEKVIALEPDNIRALNNAAWLGTQLGRDDAVDYARRAAEVAPDNGAVFDTLGWALVRTSQPAEALQYLERATQLLPGVAEIQYHLAVAQADSGDAAAARQTLDRVLAAPEVPAEIRGEAQRLRNTL